MENHVPKLILVPTDFSHASSHALRYASALAERFESHLLIIYADAFIPPIDFTAAAAGEFAISRSAMVDETTEDLIKFAEQNVSTKVPYDTRVLVDSPVHAIEEQATEAGCDLIVMGTHGRTGFRRLVVGSVTESVIRTSTVPVIAVNDLTAESAGVARVLCPVTYTTQCREALLYAAALTDSRKAPLILLRTVEIGDAKETADEVLLLRRWIPPSLVDRCEVKIIPAHATSDQILAIANATHADLIALGADRSIGVGDTLRGTVADRVVQHAGCPVLTVSDVAVPAPTEVASVY